MFRLRRRLVILWTAFVTAVSILVVLVVLQEQKLIVKSESHRYDLTLEEVRSDRENFCLLRFVLVLINGFFALKYGHTHTHQEIQSCPVGLASGACRGSNRLGGIVVVVVICVVGSARREETLSVFPYAATWCER